MTSMYGNYSPKTGIGREGGPKRDRIVSNDRIPFNSAVSMTEANAA
jgi:hypothetical protein